MEEGRFFSNVPIDRSNRSYLDRPRIDRILEQALRSPVVSVCAGAGFGKTVAVYSFLQKNNYNTVWLQFSERDNVPARFWENFTSAVSVVDTKSGTLLGETGFPETDRQFTRYLNVPRAKNNVRYIFVYDDFHLITDKRVLRFIKHSMDSSFPNITSFLISRFEPDINFKGMAEKSMLARIAEDDLRFTRDELERYFSLLDIDPPAETLHSIYRGTEGWAFAIRLAALSLQNSRRTDYAWQGIRTNIFRLIQSEVIPAVLAQMPAEAAERMKRFLVKLPLIEHLAPELLEELDSTGELIARLDAIGSFVQYDSYRRAYRIHNLFLEFLEEKQEKFLTERDKQEVYLLAAAWSVKHQRIIDAITYYEKAGDYDTLFNAIYPQLPAVIPNHIAQVLIGVYERVAPEISDRNPVTWIVYTRLLISTAEFERLIRELTEVIIPALEAFPPSARKHRVLTACYGSMGFARFFICTYTGDYSFVNDFERAMYYQNISGHTAHPPSSVLILSSYVCPVAGTDPAEMEEFLSALSAMIGFASTMGGIAWGMDDLGRAELALFRQDFDQVERFAHSALTKAREQYQYEIESRALFYLLRIYIARGDGDAVNDCLVRLEATLDIPGYVNRYLFYDIVSSWFYAQIGMGERIASWIQSDFEESDLPSLIHGLETLVKAKCQVAERRYPAALAALGSQDNNYDGVGAFLFGRIGVKALEAVCRYRMQDREGAFAALEEAYANAAPQDLFMAFTELGKDMRTLIDAYLKKRSAGGIPKAALHILRRNASVYAQRLFTIGAVFHRAGATKKEEELPVELSGAAPLSPREKQVLEGLAGGLTREEIARNLSISINTVKSVIRSVYNKLGAVNRADAVRIAAAYRNEK